jgi:hypothetical protein
MNIGDASQAKLSPSGREIGVALLQVSGEQFASAMTYQPTSKEAAFNYGYVIAQMARTRPTGECEELFEQAFELYKLAAVPTFFLYENALRYWYVSLYSEDDLCRGDALVDLAKKKENDEAEALLLIACQKYSQSVTINPAYFMGYYYWGCALHNLAKIVKEKDVQHAAEIFKQAGEKLTDAINLRADDVYTLSEMASTLHDYAQLNDAPESEELFIQAAQKYSEAHKLAPTDAFINRCWADTAYDHAKFLYGRMLG